jgi:hypothetical protein
MLNATLKTKFNLNNYTAVMLFAQDLVSLLECYIPFVVELAEFPPH